MSTRATYCFTACESRPEATLYVHHDGYPEGAARYYLEACTKEGINGSMVERFIRANDRAELVSSRTDLGTDYRYTLMNDHTLVVDKRHGDTRAWSHIFFGQLTDFIKQQLDVTLMLFRGRFLTKQAAGELLTKELEHAGDWIKRGQSGNASACANDAWHLICGYMATFGPDIVSTQANEILCEADRQISRMWRGEYGDQAYTKWREAFRKVPA